MMERRSYVDMLEQEATSTLIISLIFNAFLLVVGAVLFSFAFGWQVGIGTALFLMFIKGGMR